MNGPLTCEADPRRALVIDAIFDQENPRIANGIDFVEENFVEENFVEENFVEGEKTKIADTGDDSSV